MNIYEKLLAIQKELKAPKNQRNNFGNYNYRNCEDILEAVKPLTSKNKAVLFLSDNIIQIENRIYVEANAILVDAEKPEDKIGVKAYAREAEQKKGMDESQVTGATSSYARKYALNGLFNIDDNKDADSMNNNEEITKVKTPNVAKKPAPAKDKITDAEVKTLTGLLTPEREQKLLEYFKVEKLEELTTPMFTEALAILKATN